MPGRRMTDTDWLALADFLDAHANDMRAWTEDEPKFRATAEGLRQLDAIDRTWDGYTLQPKDVTDRVERTRLLARGQIAASLSPTPTDRNPT